ncbi:MAG: MarR family transcriptional regulator [Phycisphaerales bacterium]|nr:MarR family transcriptional regulator [Phycisphaerales bacterium]
MPYRTVHLGSRQWDLLTLVARHGSMTVTQMIEETGLARTSLRQQVDRLMGEGWLDRDRRHGQRGRPADVFSLSSQSRHLMAQQTGELAHALVEEIAHQDGESKLKSIVDGIGQRMLGSLRSVVGEGPPADRIQWLADWFAERGALSSVTRTDDSVTLTMHICPFHSVSGGRRVICEMECDLVRELVGAETQLRCCMHDGGTRCGFEVQLNGNGSEAM